MCEQFHFLEGKFGELQFGLFHCTELETNAQLLLSANHIYYSYALGTRITAPEISHPFATCILTLIIVKGSSNLGRKLQGEQGRITSEDRKVLP